MSTSSTERRQEEREHEWTRIWGDSRVIARRVPVDWQERADRWAAVSIQLKAQETGPRLSITGIVGHPSALRSGNADTCGQCINAIAAVPARCFVDGWTRDDHRRLVEYWRRWHLNDMRAACEHQRELGWTYNDHPSEPCPVCGHKLGSAWLYESLPTEVIQWAEAHKTA